MKHLFAVLTLLACSVSLSFGQGSDTRAEIVRLDRELLEACWRADDRALDRMVTDDFVYTTYAGEKLTKSEWKALISIPAQPFDKFSLTEHTVQVFGDTAVASGCVEQLFHVKSGFAMNEYRYSNVYVKASGQWRAVYGQVTPVNKYLWKRSLKLFSSDDSGVVPSTAAPN